MVTPGPASESIRRTWPCAAAILVFLATLGALVLRSAQRCGGHFGYPMDDTYIHMAMAKNFSLHGVWGITPYGFSSSTSSPLYTLLLSVCYAASGIRELTPLVLNAAAALALLAWCDFLLQRQGVSQGRRFAVLTFLVLAIPLPILAFGGMEHVLHALFTLCFVHLCSLSLAAAKPRPLLVCGLLTLSSIIVLTRYEALFLTASAGLLFLVRRRWSVAAGLVVATVVPLLIYGVISMRHGWFPLPTSLLLKANLPSATQSGMYPGFLFSLFRNATRGSHIVMLILIAGALLHRNSKKRGTVWTYSGVTLLLFMASAAMHLTMARTGWFFRYEAYLAALGIVALAIAIADIGWPDARLAWAAAAFALLLLAVRTAYAFSVAPQAAVDIFDQQYQVGLFARQYLNGETVVLNDIGAVSFLSNARVLDLIGLGSVEPARARMRNRYSAEWLREWALRRRASVAITYPNLSPPEWRPTATWRIPGNYMSGSDSVNFYALNAAVETKLRRDLAEFAPRLPSRVIEKQP